MNFLKQIVSMTGVNLRTIPLRVGSSLVIVVGIAGVVAVLVSALSIAAGIMNTMQNAGRLDRAVVLRGGASAEIASLLSREQAQNIMGAPGVKHTVDDKPIGSADVVSTLSIGKQSGNGGTRVSLRGVGPRAFILRPELTITQGRLFQSGKNEVIVGQATASQYPFLHVGGSVDVRNVPWTIVGIFRSNRDVHESEILADADTLLAAAKRNVFQSVTVQLISPESFKTFTDALARDPTLSVDVLRERQFYEQQSSSINVAVSIVAYVVGGIMAIGAVFAALNAMYSAVSNRVVEIATFRAIGFRPSAVVICVLIESLLLALVGSLVGGALAWLLLNGHTFSSTGGGAAGQFVFSLDVQPQLIVLGAVWACAIGLIGGFFPAIRAARLPVATALRGA